MTSVQDPAVQRRRLRVALRDIRQKRGLAQKEVAKALDWSPSKLLRIENGSVPISRSDLIALLAHYGIDDQARVNELLEMAQAAKRQTWSEYRGVLHPATLVYIESEAAASLIRQFQPFAIPGLLQTEEYARALVRALSPHVPEEHLDKNVQARLDRQELLARDEPPEMFFILDEAVVRRRIGPGKVMVHQLERLKQAAAHPRIHIQILPFSVGAHTGITEPFTVLEFPEPGDDDLLYIERANIVGRDNPEEVQRYKSIFFVLEDLATPKDQIGSVIDRAIDQLEGRHDSITGDDM